LARNHQVRSPCQVSGTHTVLAAKIIGHSGTVERFPSCHHYASSCGTAPIEGPVESSVVIGFLGPGTAS